MARAHDGRHLGAGDVYRAELLAAIAVRLQRVTEEHARAAPVVRVRPYRGQFGELSRSGKHAAARRVSA